MPVRRVNRRVLTIAAHQLMQPISAILRRQHLKLPILGLAAEIRYQSLSLNDGQVGFGSWFR
jgi:hypothetical protein